MCPAPPPCSASIEVMDKINKADGKPNGTGTSVMVQSNVIFILAHQASEITKIL
jgi:hypothetical protein